MAIESVKCPTCDGPMVSRQQRTTGRRFWGCRRFPECTGTRNTDGEAPGEGLRRQDREDDEGEPSESSYDRARRNDRRRW